MKLSNSYLQLGEAFFQKTNPSKVTQPNVLLWNAPLNNQLNLDFDLEADTQRIADIFSGNTPPSGSQSIALAYAGHQFGHFNPSLGDGRAHLLGEVKDNQGIWQDIQLKGSGPTAFSRQGDGRCGIGPAIREFIMSEAMHHLGVPTTRCLAVIGTGEQVYRQTPVEGAVVTRVAQSHIRVGTFQYFAARGLNSELKGLADYCIQRLYPELLEETEDRWLKLLERVMEKQIKLMCEWARVGFIHGVMNTDNTAISGQTIDFGPCAMLEIYDPAAVFSSIDSQGRYAFGNQPTIARWNLIRLAECLIPLISSDAEVAIAKMEPIVHGYAKQFEDAYLKMMSAKLGIVNPKEADLTLIQLILDGMKSSAMDYTLTFNRLRRSLSEADQSLQIELGESYQLWRDRIKQQLPEASELMAISNPLVIPRNHIVESIVSEFEQTGESKLLDDFLRVIRQPYTQLPETSLFQTPASDGDRNYKTFCGT